MRLVRDGDAELALAAFLESVGGEPRSARERRVADALGSRATVGELRNALMAAKVREAEIRSGRKRAE